MGKILRLEVDVKVERQKKDMLNDGLKVLRSKNDTHSKTNDLKKTKY